MFGMLNFIQELCCIEDWRRFRIEK